MSGALGPSAATDPMPVMPQYMWDYKTSNSRADSSTCANVLLSRPRQAVHSPFWRNPLTNASTVPEMPVPVSGLNCVILVSRFTARWVLSAIFPIMATTWLGFLVFFLPRDDMNGRLGSIVALFLALAAIQFVVDQDVPASSYITPLQQLTLASYLSLILVGGECVVIWWLTTYHVEKVKLRRHLEAQRNYKDKLSAVRQALDAWLERAQAPYRAPPPRQPSRSKLWHSMTSPVKGLGGGDSSSSSPSKDPQGGGSSGVGAAAGHGGDASGSGGASGSGRARGRDDAAPAAAAAAAAVSPAPHSPHGEVRLVVDGPAGAAGSAAAAAPGAAGGPPQQRAQPQPQPQQAPADADDPQQQQKQQQEQQQPRGAVLCSVESLVLEDAATQAAIAAAQLAHTEAEASGTASHAPRRGGLLRFMRRGSGDGAGAGGGGRAAAAAAPGATWADPLSAAAASDAAELATPLPRGEQQQQPEQQQQQQQRGEHLVAAGGGGGFGGAARLRQAAAAAAAGGAGAAGPSSSDAAAAADGGASPPLARTRSGGGMGDVVHDLMAAHGKDISSGDSRSGGSRPGTSGGAEPYRPPPAAPGSPPGVRTPGCSPFLARRCQRLHMFLEEIYSDDAFADRVAHKCNKWCAISQLVLYNATVVLIFSLNSYLYRIS